ncbi:MAG: histidine kinase N-terminal 7TM domain-containing protein [Haloferacaceae archaeon]
MLVSIAVGTAATILAWRQRPEPGAVPLVALLVGQSWWSTCIVFKLQATTFDAKLLWTDLAWIGVVVIPVAWFLFALEYTGHDQYVRPRYVALLSVVPAITVVLALTSQFHHLLYVRPLGVETNGVVQLEQGGAWYWVIAGYTYLLGLFGIVPLAGLLTSDATTFRGQGATLLVGLLAPWVTNVLFLAGALPTSGIDPTPVAFSVSGVAYLNALTRFRLFGTSPAPNTRARKLLFDRMQEGAIVVDRNDYVVETNDSALDVLGLDSRDVLGRHAGDVVPEYDRLPDDGALPGYLTIGDPSGGRQYDVTVTRIRNVRGRAIGRVVTFHDVSQHLRQQQRLEVLNRALRHNIRTETNVIHGYADGVPNDDARIIKERALRITEIGRKGQEAIELFERGREDRTPKSLVTLLEQCLATVREAYPEVTVDFDRPDRDVAVAELLTPVFSNVVENAAEHHSGDDPHVRVTVRFDGNRVRVDVSDDGPGIDDYEIAVLDDGTETALRHGSGLGLWIAKWGAEIADGTVRFDSDGETGSTVTVEVPVLPGEP